ncbi:MAG TPA: DegT/DnrJ/EryC1/StrS family aminotransferase [Rhodocyclaceae bacterium]|nr:DegT/DnrJ/EryC1/StrS family aminotransferase [Rhodocyclaceae bacterium]HMV20030.1 DegT/DnrJ/EryC1/StrS family aminotransferase [Rhodocyclaceae bacterium]HMW77581.1 DegT/DnrJ/EryC1/StrS family aminotransferase [Rhodocyclaceae bacterium]HNE42382.1 DegT/DnrJ/EryC1/StrS family aminotransferase [Rhodocyclaceae bacterium]HNL22018.1 DegT/DnrJ/EryC1/StrS family aminotransferase [Rhodocyclaceae bacterium]
MITSFRVFDPTPCRFPAPNVPLLPTPGTTSFSRRTASRYHFLGEGLPGIFFSRGRYALRAAYLRAGVGPGKVLLAPAYHCRTMLDPAIRIGADIMLYPVTPTLEPDWEAMKSLLDNPSVQPSALLITHYFGIRQNMQQAAQFCGKFGLALIEDCSHAYICRRNSPPPGSFSDHVVASPYKFVPSADGGLLISRGTPVDEGPVLSSQGLVPEIKSVWRIIERCSRPARQLPEFQETGDSGALGREYRQPGDALSAMYDPKLESLAGFRSSKLAIKLSSPDRIADARLANYAMWLKALAGVPHCRPLFPNLPEDCVPYMFPLHIDFPEPHFYRLKRLGVPIWRWDEMAESECSVSMEYRDHLLHLPCHQSLDAKAMDWMTRMVAGVLRGEANRAS